MRLRRRWWRIVLAAALVAALAAILGWRQMERHLLDSLRRRLAAWNGASVQIERVDLGLRGLDLTGVRLLESKPNAPAWMSFERLHLQAPIWEILSEDSLTRQIVIDGANIRLRFDRNGNLLNRFARVEGTDFPRLHIDTRGLRVEVVQEGRPPLAATQIDLQVRGLNEHLRVSGSVGQLLDAPWKFESEIDGRHGSAEARLTTPRLRFDTGSLGQLPLVPAESLSTVHAQGVTSVSAAVRFEATEPFRYQIHLEPKSTVVEIPAIALRLRNAGGKLRLKDGVLSAEGLTSEFADGRLTAEGQLDLRKRPFLGRVSLAASDVSISQLPDVWSELKDLEGVSSGQVELQIAVGDRDVFASGHGDGTIHQPAIFGLPTSPIQATLGLTRLSHDFDNESTEAEGTLRFDLKMDEVAARDVLPRLKITPESWAVSVDGNASVEASLEIPLASFRDTASYRGSAAVSFGELVLGGVRLTSAQAIAKYAGGRVVVDSFAGHLVDGGRLSGNGSANIAPRGPITGEVKLERVPVELLNRLSRHGVGDAVGDVSGVFRVTGTVEHWKKIDAWEMSGDVSAETLTVDGHAFVNAASRVSLKDSVVSITGVQAAWNGASVSGQAKINLQAPHSFVADFAFPRMYISEISALSDTVRLPAGTDAQIAITGTTRGQLAPLSFSASGKGSLRDAKFDRFKIPDTDFAWRMNPREAAIAADNIEMFAGSIEVQANMPLDGEEGSLATITFVGIDAALASKHFGALPIELTGKTDGKLTLANFHDFAKLAAKASLKGASTRLQSIALDQLAAELDLHANVADYRLTGNVLGGQLEFAGTGPIGEVHTQDTEIPGKLKLRNIRLSQLAEHLGQAMRTGLAPMRGQLTAELDVTLRGPELQPEGHGWIELHDVQWDREELASDMRGVVLLTPSSLQIRNLGIDRDEGSLRGEWTTVFDSQQTSSFGFTATRINVKRLLAPWPDVARRVEGTVDARVVGEVGADWTGTAQVSVSRAKVMSIPVGTSRVPIDWAYSPTTGRGRIRIRETALQVARGRVTAGSTFDWGRTVNVDATARLAALDAKSLMQAAPHIRGLQNGRLNGKLQLKGKNVRSLKDLQGSFRGTLQNAQTLQLPVLRNLTRFLDVGRVETARFDSSEIEVRLAKGVVHVDRMAIANNAAQLLIDGRVSLTGRLDLNVVAHAGQFDSQPELGRLIRASALLAQPMAVAVLVEANDFLSDRLVYLHVGGTLRSPSIRLQPARLLQQEATRFFLRKATDALVP